MWLRTIVLCAAVEAIDWITSFRMNRRIHCWPLAFALGLLLSPSAHALDPAKSVYQFNVQNWTRHDGLQGNKVNAITQTSDGYI